MRIFLSWLLATVLMTQPLYAEAHRYHFGLTELSVNEGTQSLEISHRFFVADLERALSLSAARETKDAQKQMEDYVNMRFRISGENGETLKPQWVGVDADVHDVWIYQEIPLAKVQGHKIRLHQSMLMEIERDQINTLNVIKGGETQSFTLKPGASQVTVSL